MVLNNINNLIIITESVLGDVAGNTLLNGVKHGVKQFGRGLTDIVHLGKFNALDTAKTNVNRIRDRLKNEASTTKIKELRALSDEASQKAEHFKTKFRDAMTSNRTNRKHQYFDYAADEIAKSASAAREANELSHQRRNLRQWISKNKKTVKELRTQLDLTDVPSGKLARVAGRATAGIAATGGTVAGINAATNKLAASNNKEESK